MLYMCSQTCWAPNAQSDQLSCHNPHKLEALNTPQLLLGYEALGRQDPPALSRTSLTKDISARRKSICTVSVHSGCVTKPWVADDGDHSITKKAHQAFIQCQQQCYLNPPLFPIFYRTKQQRLTCGQQGCQDPHAP